MSRDLAQVLHARAAEYGAGGDGSDTVIPSGALAGSELASLLGVDGGEAWVRWAVRRPDEHWPADFRLALERFAAGYFPEVWSERRPA